MKKNRGISVFLLALALSAMALPAANAEDEESPGVPTGLLELEGYRYPVLLLVPESYSPKQAYPLIVAIPPEGKEAKDAIKYWEGMSRRRNMIVLAPANLRAQDMPTRVDEWILGILNDVMLRYRIAKDRVYLFGKDQGAHYAAYLGTAHPEAFSAIALVGGSWIGKYEALIKPRSDANEQRPFLIYLREDQKDLYETTMAKALQFESKGYPVQIKTVGGEDDLTKIEFKKQLFELLETKNQEWQTIVSESSKTFKQRARQTLKEFFAV